MREDGTVTPGNCPKCHWKLVLSELKVELRASTFDLQSFESIPYSASKSGISAVHCLASQGNLDQNNGLTYYRAASADEFLRAWGLLRVPIPLQRRCQSGGIQTFTIAPVTLEPAPAEAKYSPRIFRLPGNGSVTEGNYSGAVTL